MESLKEFLNRINGRYYTIFNGVKYKVIKTSKDEYHLVHTNKDLPLLDNDDYTRLFEIRFTRDGKTQRNFLLQNDKVYFLVDIDKYFVMNNLGKNFYFLGKLEEISDGDYYIPPK